MSRVRGVSLVAGFRSFFGANRVNRTELQRLSNQRIQDALSLLNSQCWSGAYYLAGYSLECGLKSCILAFVERTGIIFEDNKFAANCWTHDVETLVKQAGLKPERDKDMASNPILGANWQIAKDWSELARYRFFSQTEAEKLYNALTDHTDGVLPWIQQRW